MAEAEADKRELRQDVLAVRFRLPADDVSAAAARLARRALAVPEVAAAGTVAAYVSIGTEPGTRPLLDSLRELGIRVLLPVLQPDNDLDWAVYEGADALVRADRGLREPVGPRLGPSAVTGADVVLLPGVAVDERGMRLGRGGGSYDRVLARLDAVGARPLRMVLLYENEVVTRVPAERHDQPVDAVVTPSGVRRFGSAR